MGYETYPQRVHRCRSEISRVRTGMEHWCLNNEQGFYASNGFHVSGQNCKHLDTEKCSMELLDEFRRLVRHGKMKPNAIRLEIAQKLLAATEAYKQMELQRIKYNTEREKFNHLKELFSEDVLKEMNEHLRNPHETNTRFNDPVFKTIAKTEKELNRLKRWFADYNLNKAQEEERKAKVWTTRAIKWRM